MSLGLAIRYSQSIYKVHEVCGKADHILGYSKMTADSDACKRIQKTK